MGDQGDADDGARTPPDKNGSPGRDEPMSDRDDLPGVRSAGSGGEESERATAALDGVDGAGNGDGERTDDAPCHGEERIRNMVLHAFEALHLQARSGERLPGLTFGFDRLDNMTGGMHPGDLIVLAARPGMGKSALALNIAVNACHSRQGCKTRGGVLLFSLEVDKEMLIQRMLCSEARVDSARVRAGRVRRGDWESLAHAGATLTDLDFYVDDNPCINIPYIAEQARRKSPDLGLIVIDYVQLIRPEIRGDTREREITEIVRALKLLARTLRVPILAISQLNRGLETRTNRDKRPILADLRETGALEEEADLVLLLYRDEVYNRESMDLGIAEVNVAKQRWGPTGRVKLRFFAHCTRFDDLQDESTCAAEV